MAYKLDVRLKVIVRRDLDVRLVTMRKGERVLLVTRDWEVPTDRGLVVELEMAKRVNPPKTRRVDPFYLSGLNLPTYLI